MGIEFVINANDPSLKGIKNESGEGIKFNVVGNIVALNKAAPQGELPLPKPNDMISLSEGNYGKQSLPMDPSNKGNSLGGK